MNTPSQPRRSISQRIALYCAFVCLIISLALIGLAAISSQHMQNAQQSAYGVSLAQQIARRISTALETGDLVSVAASLQRFVETSSADEVAIFDVEGTAIGRAGQQPIGPNASYHAPVLIGDAVAGEVIISTSTQFEQRAYQRFLFSLLALALVSALAVYGISKYFGQKTSNKLRAMAKKLVINDDSNFTGAGLDEIELLSARINALPMDLLKTRGITAPRDENYRTTGVLYLHLRSLSEYADTLDEQSLRRYTDQIHQIIYSSAGFYAGDISVARQFGISICFSGTNSGGSAAFRGACCAWLIRSVCHELEPQISRSMQIDMALSQSELGLGDETDIYPGLYIQHTIDELQQICDNRPPDILLSPAVTDDVDISSRSEFRCSELNNYCVLESFVGPHQDLLERQRQLIWKHISTTPASAPMSAVD